MLEISPIQQRATVADWMDMIHLFAKPDHASYLAVPTERMGGDESRTTLIPVRGVSALPEVPSPPIAISADSL